MIIQYSINSKTTDSSFYKRWTLLIEYREEDNKQNNKRRNIKLPSKAVLNCSASSDGEGTEEETLRVAIFALQVLSFVLLSVYVESRSRHKLDL